LFDEIRRWIRRQHHALLDVARRVHVHFINSLERWLSGLVAFSAALIILLNLRGLIRRLRARSLRAHPERGPQEAAALWYDRMVGRLARLGWRKAPSQTPLDFVAAIQETSLQNKVAKFTRAYESARFGRSLDDAQSLPELFNDINAETTRSRQTQDSTAGR
jgi:hypothetical protein